MSVNVKQINAGLSILVLVVWLQVSCGESSHIITTL